MILVVREPDFFRERAERSALSSIASMYTSFASRGSALFALASIMSVSRSWSSEPQFTPMRTGLSCSMAAWTMVVKFASRCLLPDVARIDAILVERSGAGRILRRAAGDRCSESRR